MSSPVGPGIAGIAADADAMTEAYVRAQAEAAMNVEHTCAGVDHTTDIQPATTQELGCGCTLHRGIRCDGTRIEWLDPAVCTLHRTEETP